MGQFLSVFLSGPLCYLPMHLCWMNTCIVVHSRHRMTLCYKFKQPGPLPPADGRGCEESGTRPVWSEVCLCWCPGVYGRSPFDPRIACQGGKCLQHSFFPSVRRFFPVSSQCSWNIRTLPPWWTILWQDSTNRRTWRHTHICVCRFLKKSHTVCKHYKKKKKNQWFFLMLSGNTKPFNLPNCRLEMLAVYFRHYFLHSMGMFNCVAVCVCTTCLVNVLTCVFVGAMYECLLVCFSSIPT